ncbi:MAG: hypothetical protein ABI165_15920, partial [Bryobacteraceae bacterium]
MLPIASQGLATRAAQPGAGGNQSGADSQSQQRTPDLPTPSNISDAASKQKSGAAQVEGILAKDAPAIQR